MANSRIAAYLEQFVRSALDDRSQAGSIYLNRFIIGLGQSSHVSATKGYFY